MKTNINIKSAGRGYKWAEHTKRAAIVALLKASRGTSSTTFLASE
jgi:hypothetical protein